MIEESIALVTGANKGIGFEIAGSLVNEAPASSSAPATPREEKRLLPGCATRA